MMRIKKQLLQLICASFVAGTFIWPFVSFSVAADEVSQEQLDSVTKELGKTHQVTKRAQKLLARLEKQLKSDELQIARQTQKVARTQQEIIQHQQQLDQLKSQAQTLQQQQQQQRQLLRQNMIAAYQMGQGSYLKMLLNQNKTAQLERMMGYYQYLTQARLEQIKALEQTTQQLTQNQQQQQQRLESLNQLLADQKQLQNQLAKQQQKRQHTAKQTNRLLANSRLKTEQLNQAKAYLARELAENAIPEVQLSGLTHHQLNWPVTGKIIHDYHSLQLGGNRWDGVVLQAKLGTPVKAIADGQVVFADWLRGYGLVIALNHGHHYLSLYGYNQSLLHQVGDKVSRGQPIATVGNTGGQEQPTLYFQIRYKSGVEDPHQFIR
ncbi:murein hydrolase activator EnvC family protein [Celerinatantimonas sp. YJH-8]|uniref:murein hydrolase activator EnvC family protein n=1 Tax=Celerinatantimonas sp. YJH-8 TaxID=3228714 RepID=UPI0038BF694C